MCLSNGDTLWSKGVATDCDKCWGDINIHLQLIFGAAQVHCSYYLSHRDKPHTYCGLWLISACTYKSKWKANMHPNRGHALIRGSNLSHTQQEMLHVVRENVRD